MILFKIIRNLIFNRNVYSIPPLGRWKINYCNNVIRSNVDLANQDNCAKLYISKK